jgi:hypothetical protein
MNGIVERFMYTLSDSLRALLCLVDFQLWCYASEYLGYNWDRLPREYKRAPEHSGKTPMEAVADRRPESTAPKGTNIAKVDGCRKLRRFGCLAFVLRQPREDTRKLHQKYQRCVFLGYSKQNNSAYLFGTWEPDRRCSSGYRWKEIESVHAKFFENELVGDIRSLYPRSKTDHSAVGPLKQAIGGPKDDEPVVHVGQHGAPESSDPRCPEKQAETVPEQNKKNQPKAKKRPPVEGTKLHLVLYTNSNFSGQ